MLSISLLNSSCKKEEVKTAPCETVHKAPEEFLDYWFFPEGSYWVYKKQGTEEIDTLYCYSTRQSYLSYGAAGAVSCSYSYFLRHSNDVVISGIWSLSVPAGYYTLTSGFGVTLFEYTLKIRENIMKFDSLALLGNVYLDVIHCFNKRVSGPSINEVFQS